MASKKRKKAKKPVKRGRKKSAARSSSAKRGGKRVTLSMAQLRALTKGKSKSRKKAKRGGRRSASSDFFDVGMSYRDNGKLPRGAFANVGASAHERKLLAEVNRSARAVEALDYKMNEQARIAQEKARIARYSGLAQEQLDELRAERSAKNAEREAKFKIAIAKHRKLVNDAIDSLSGSDSEVANLAKELGKVRKAS